MAQEVFEENHLQVALIVSAPVRVALALPIPAPEMTFSHIHCQEEQFIDTAEESKCL
jgi:hypothetical protein